MAAVVALRFFPFPFLTFPLALSLWYMSMDLTPLIFGQTSFTWNERLWVSFIFGLFTVLIAYIIDIRIRTRDYAFWIYLFGALAFLCGLSLIDTDNELAKFIYCLLNVGLIFFSVYIRRNIFIILGSLGVFGYTIHLAYEVFKDSYLFPIALSVLGLLIIYVGIQYQVHKDRIEAFVESLFPQRLWKWRPPKRY